MSFSNDNNLTVALGQIYQSATMVNTYKATMTQEDFDSIYESGGMDGVKYRMMMFAALVKGLETHMSTVWRASGDEFKRMAVSILAVMLGMYFGTTPGKRTLVKNMKGHMSMRNTRNDPMWIGWETIGSEFCTYVNGEVTGKVPSLKYPSCMADFCMVGVCILASTHKNAQYWKEAFLTATGTVKDFADWPELFRKQWIGNFKLNSAFQDNHMAWERTFWETVVTKTKNTKNTEFKKEFTEEFYENTRTDNIHLLSNNLGRVTPPNDGYTAAQMVDFILSMIALFTVQGIDTTIPNAWADFTAAGDHADEAEMTIVDFLTDVRHRGLLRGKVGETTVAARVT